MVDMGHNKRLIGADETCPERASTNLGRDDVRVTGTLGHYEEPGPIAFWLR